MTPLPKIKIISQIYKKDFNNLISGWYTYDSLNTVEISEKIFAETKISIAPQSIQKRLKSLHLTRFYSDAFKLAITKGRKDYTHLTKPIKANELRYDNAILVIDHIIQVVRGGTNDISNLQTLCTACNHGKMIYEHEK